MGQGGLETDLSHWLAEYAEGDKHALNHIVEVLYPELRQRARYQLLTFGRSSPTLATNVIVNEVYCKFVNSKGQTPSNRMHFLRAASKAMRQVIVDYARLKQTAKRGSGSQLENFDGGSKQAGDYEKADGEKSSDIAYSDLVFIDKLLIELGDIDLVLREIIEYRYFIGLTELEISNQMQIPYRTVQRKSELARALLRDIAND